MVQTMMPLDAFIEYNGSNVSNEEACIVVGEDKEWGGICGSSSKKRRTDETIGARREKLGSSATFGGYEDYVTMIEDGHYQAEDKMNPSTSPNLQLPPTPFCIHLVMP